MKIEHVEKAFETIGARVKFVEPLSRRPGARAADFLIDVQQDRKGERFEIRLRPKAKVDLLVQDVQPHDRRLLLLVKGASYPGKRPEDSGIQRFLCGHDEREWFVAAIPEKSGASTVRAAMEALKPQVVQDALEAVKVKPKDRNKRRNPGFVRQGEWFFIPSPNLEVDELLVLKDEPLVRGRGKPHRAEFLYRRGGAKVYVCREYPNGVSEQKYSEIVRLHPEKKRMNWRRMVRDPEAYVKGRITHPDHKTVVLPCWHRVVPNRESEAAAMRNVAFLD